MMFSGVDAVLRIPRVAIAERAGVGDAAPQSESAGASRSAAGSTRRPSTGKDLPIPDRLVALAESDCRAHRSAA